MKKIILATLISGAMSASALAAVDAGKGTVTFNGSIIEAPCSIAPGEENQTVELGQISNVTLEKGGESAPQPFSIKLVGCNLADDNQVTVTFAGTEAAPNTGLLQITGDASGAAVKIMNSSNALIKVNTGSTQNYVQGSNELKFQAALQGLTGVTPVPGNFSAVTNFTLAYN